MKFFHARNCQAIGLLALSILGFTGCSHTQPGSADVSTVTGPEYVVYDASSGAPIEWSALESEAFGADVILVGEQHTNEIGHDLEHRLVDDLLAQYPRSAIALEMFERNEQAFVDLYLDDKIEVATLVDITKSADWASKGSWGEFYQPMVDSVKKYRGNGASLVAANSPREYARLARLESYATMESAVTAHQPVLAIAPDEAVDDQAYHDRFVGMMTGHGHGEGAPTIDAESYLRAQRVWDATMADAVVNAAQHHDKVLLVVGEFHIADQGGTLQRVRHHAPELTVATISIIRREDVTAWNAEDAARADFVIYTR
ncbi:ChaN family lipoprotein [Cerasicoccus frondis]|uniref:ChaN family lipoprotein n=1 Tax=Cerasicoccus frondis TaxID=490090 RepID=UPI002852AE60|nr:ChaN family lipoprotein [Cerasicoccus frondis]